MKKALYLFSALIVAICFTSCEYNSVNKTDVVYKNNTITLDLHVKSADWQWSQDGGYYFYTFSVSELNKTIYDTGIVVCYREFNKGTSDAYQISLPRIFPRTDGNDTYSEIVDFSYLPGSVEVAVTNSDLKYDLNTNPEDMDFRLVMQWVPQNK